MSTQDRKKRKGNATILAEEFNVRDLPQILGYAGTCIVLTAGLSAGKPGYVNVILMGIGLCTTLTGILMAVQFRRKDASEPASVELLQLLGKLGIEAEPGASRANAWRLLTEEIRRSVGD